MLCISITCEVLKLDRSIEVNDEQKANILSVNSILVVLNFDKLISIIEVHLKNINPQLFKLSSHINSTKLFVSLK